MFVMFSIGGLFFVVYGIVTDDREPVTFALACFAMAKAANAMLRTFDLEDRSDV